jgi:hypothetical protein
MQDHQRNASARIRLGTLIVGIALSMVAFGMSPAHAAAAGGTALSSRAPADRSAPRAKVVYRTTVPKWVGRPGAQQVQLPGTSNVSVDWQWLRGGWEVKFSKTETIIIGISAGACDSFLGRFSHPVLKVLSLSCLALTVLSGIYLARGQCVTAWVPVSLINPTIYGRNC